MLFNCRMDYYIMRPKRFGKKPSATSPERFRRVTGIMPKEAMKQIKG